MRAPLLLACLALLAACSNIESAAPRPKPISSVPKPSFEIEVDPILRGTVASEAILLGFRDSVVRGYGIVVGLKGTGSRMMPAEVRALLLQELARREISDTVKGMGLSPERFLNSDDIAAVVIEGIVPAGATRDSRFDVRVYAVPGSGTTSLEGGRLWTADLRAGPLVAGSRQAAILAEAKGPVLINPFAPAASGSLGDVDRLSGRILDGGRVLKDMPLRLRLATPSHSRAGTIVSAINSRFAREPGQTDDTARGKSGELIDLTVPPSYHDSTRDFAQLVRHLSLDVQNSEAIATSVRRSLLANPGTAEAASWRWQAIGKKAVPMLHDLYTHPEEQPRFAALEAGAKLDDPLAVNPLLKMARSAKQSTRLASIRLLGGMGDNPAIDVGLRPLLDDDDLDVRLTTYEMLRKRHDPTVETVRVNNRFDLDMVRSSKPLVYAAQTGPPRIAVFGEDVKLRQPMMQSMWNGKLIVRLDDGDAKAKVFFRSDGSERPRIEQAKPEAQEFIPFLARTPSPSIGSAGLDLTYGETLGVLYDLARERNLGCDFRGEQDRILAAITREDKEVETTERPDFPDEKPTQPGVVPPPTPKPPPDKTPGLDARPKAADTVPR
jgi:hypothetical protein